MTFNNFSIHITQLKCPILSFLLLFLVEFSLNLTVICKTLIIHNSQSRMAGIISTTITVYLKTTLSSIDFARTILELNLVMLLALASTIKNSIMNSHWYLLIVCHFPLEFRIPPKDFKVLLILVKGIYKRMT